MSSENGTNLILSGLDLQGFFRDSYWCKSSTQLLQSFCGFTSMMQISYFITSSKILKSPKADLWHAHTACNEEHGKNIHHTLQHLEGSGAYANLHQATLVCLRCVLQLSVILHCLSCASCRSSSPPGLQRRALSCHPCHQHPQLWLHARFCLTELCKMHLFVTMLSFCSYKIKLVLWTSVFYAVLTSFE